jgi:hypothetical protein
MPLLDHRGEPLPEPPRRHVFGQFVLPAGCHIKGFGGIAAEDHRREPREEDCRGQAPPRDAQAPDRR